MFCRPAEDERLSLSENTDVECIRTRGMTTLSVVLELGNGDSKAGASGKVNIAVTGESRSVRFCFTLCQAQVANAQATHV